SGGCAPRATKSGPMPKSSLVHRSTGLMAARAALSTVSTTPQPIKLPASRGVRKLSPNISAPMQDMPGTRMAFVGIKNDKDIADLWAYLKQFGADGAKK